MVTILPDGTFQVPAGLFPGRKGGFDVDGASVGSNSASVTSAMGFASDHAGSDFNDIGPAHGGDGVGEQFPSRWRWSGRPEKATAFTPNA